jgi:hypothetical protein
VSGERATLPDHVRIVIRGDCDIDRVAGEFERLDPVSAERGPAR